MPTSPPRTSAGSRAYGLLLIAMSWIAPLDSTAASAFDRRVFASGERFDAAAWDRGNANWLTYVDLNLRLPELLLMRVDKMSMGVSLEGRVPFLDHEFVALALSIPSRLKLKDGELKHVLKRSVRGVIPDELIDRPKQGFGVPVNEMLPGRLLTAARAEVARFAADTGLLDAAAADRVMTTADGAKVWYLMNLAMWWRHFVARQPLVLEEQAA